MTSPRTRPRRVAVVDVISDSMGREVVPKNYRLVGPENIVMECIMDSKARNDAVTLLHDAEEARGTLESIRAREEAVKKREDAVNSAVRSGMLKNFAAKLDALASRMDEFEAQQAKLAHDDDLLPEPPVSLAPPATTTGDDGELASPVPVPEIEKFQSGPRSPVAAEDA